MVVMLGVADTEGLVKILSDKKTDRMLGAHIVGSVNHLCVCLAIVCDHTHFTDCWGADQ